MASRLLSSRLRIGYSSVNTASCSVPLSPRLLTRRLIKRHSINPRYVAHLALVVEAFGANHRAVHHSQRSVCLHQYRHTAEQRPSLASSLPFSTRPNTSLPSTLTFIQYYGVSPADSSRAIALPACPVRFHGLYCSCI